MKQLFVITNDYGQGALWQRVLAESELQLKLRYRDIEVYREVPDTIDERTANRIRSELPLDIDDPPPDWLAMLRR